MSDGRDRETPVAAPVSPDELWRRMVTLVMESREDWRRAVIAQTGLPFSRVRVLRRLRRGPRSMKDLAAAATIDAPATTVAVNDLESRGLVSRTVDPDNRRIKRVSLSEAGREMLRGIDAIQESAPDALADLSDTDLQVLDRVLTELVNGMHA